MHINEKAIWCINMMAKSLPHQNYGNINIESRKVVLEIF